MVMGPHQAGKSTLIHRLDPWAVKMDYTKGTFSTTVGFDYGIILWDATENRIYRKNELDLVDPTNEIWKVTLTGTPGQNAFSPVRKVLAKGKDGVILVIDSAKPVQMVYALNQYREARETAGSVPLVIFANKQDLSRAMDPDTIASLMGIKTRIRVEPISALKGDNVEDSVLKFLKEVRRSIIARSISEVAERRASNWISRTKMRLASRI